MVKEERSSLIEVGEYYWRFTKQVFGELLQFGRDQIVAVILGIAILVCQVYFGVLKTEDFRSNELAIVWPYLVLVGFYLLVQIARAPLILDRARRIRISELEKKLCEEVTNANSRRIEQNTTALLAAQMTQAGDLFQAGRIVSSSDQINAWNVRFDAWFTNTLRLIEIHVSAAEAILFREVQGGPLINHYTMNPLHNRSLNTLCGYQENLRRVIERYSDR